MPTPKGPPNSSTSFRGINHLKLPCTSITNTMSFYTHILPFTHVPKWDHFTPDHKIFARMATHEDLIVEFRHVPAQAAVQKGWDPITWGVGTRKDLEEWAEWLDANGVPRSKILVGIKGWVLACEDPDGRVVRFYVEDEEHEWTDYPDRDEKWLGSVVADPELAGERREEAV